MRLLETPLVGAFLIEPERVEDERGFFARTFSTEEFEARGLETRWVQLSLSYNRKKGTLRGMHFQRAPFEEVKLVGCTAGAVHDLLLDLRPGSPTFGHWLRCRSVMRYLPVAFVVGNVLLAGYMLVRGSEFAHLVPRVSNLLRFAYG